MKFANRSQAYLWMHANRNKRVFFESQNNTYFTEMNEQGMLKENCLKFLEDDAHNLRTEDDDKPEIDWKKVYWRDERCRNSNTNFEMLQEFYNQLVPILDERYKK